jgi:heme O synthase-like polyprenyltransferase
VTETRPAFYALRPGGWRDYVTLLHPPYTAWHLSYVAIGAGLAPELDWPVLGLTVLAFALAMGVGAHALDELRDRPLGTAIPDGVLVLLAVVSVAAAAALGVAVALERSLWLLAFVAAGCFLVVAYNLELAGGRFHTDLWFALGWGAFPLLTGYFAVAERIRLDALLAGGFAALLSHAQRTLSKPVRALRRKVQAVEGTIMYRDGEAEPIGAESIAGTPERSLKILAAATLLLAAALLVQHLVD